MLRFGEGRYHILGPARHQDRSIRGEIQRFGEDLQRVIVLFVDLCVEFIYRQLDQSGHIERRHIKQLYDEDEGMFLPDRFIRGTCPKCGTEDQYGDSC